ncbi:SacI domain and endonuclease/exonuclease/phosphatase [Histoplasma capsulatum H143]|uniref:phosphoinositide 5-phosphatase n=1 Tax=Ajellomyces capsulatus (strain H143) TaxID=544712 RepID=C6HSJ0_AJECH|nr:SacI domain and endonuclease/exonuclease/phosphatase [Histoplasma capsulatum H143]
MSLRVLCRDHPDRALALISDDHALILHHVPITSESTSAASYSHVSPPKCHIEFAGLDALDLSGYRILGRAHGTIGLIALNSDIFLCTISQATQAATVRPGETVQRIINVEFYCLNRSDYDNNVDYESRSTFAYPSDDGDYGTGYEGREVITETPFLPLKKLLSDGSFYFSVDFNLTDRLQDRAEEISSFDIDSLDRDFLWNSFMIEPLLLFRSHLLEAERVTLDSCRILTTAIRGFVHTLTIPASTPLLRSSHSNLPSSLTLISRLSSRRAGTRFNSRGIDDEGNVSNFVETETVVWIPPGMCFSYTQVRGSLPIFWEQSVAIGGQKIQVTRSTDASQPAFDKHFDNLSLTYGAVHVVNLLTELKPGEAELSERYRYHISRSPLRHGRDPNTSSEHHLLRATDFDFHAETRGPAGYQSASIIRHLIQDSADAFAFFLCTDVPQKEETLISTDDANNGLTVVLQQQGVFRTNCLDCLDRTNLVQTIISRMALESFLEQQGGKTSDDFWRRHSTLWADNGDNLSKIYAGSGALKSSYTRHGKMSLAGAFADIRKSAARLYMNTFTDSARQNTIDLLLGTLTGQSTVHLYDPISDSVNRALRQRALEYTSSKTVRIWVGTFNLNGRTNGANGTNLSPWLLSQLDNLQETPSIFAIGFQEIVELSPQQIMSTDPGNRMIWENAVKHTLNDYANRKGESEYVLLRSGQLVGTALLIFVKSELLSEIKVVEGSVKKTGMSGMAGNKGGCAIRFQYSNTRICFVTAHLAAGFSNYDERNRDYQTINQGLRFQRNRSIEDHDTIIWLGDFNYRIGLPDDTVRGLIKAGDFESLYSHDQLNLQMVAGLTFPFYSEARITFPPTYKYDNGTDQYDTSEKARTPAWCDRILWKGANIRLLEYNAAPLKFSDHRPVYATFDCEISMVNENLKEHIRRQLYEAEQDRVANGREMDSGSEETDDEDDQDLIGFDAIDPYLPPASSDRHKWWLDQGLPAKSTLKPPSGFMVNQHRPPNPFSTTAESDWIHIPYPDTSPAKSQVDGTSEIAKPRVPRPATSLRNEPLIDFEKEDDPSPNSLASSKSLSGLVISSNGEVGVPKKRAPPVPTKPLSMSTSLARSPSTAVFANASPSHHSQVSSTPISLEPQMTATRATQTRAGPHMLRHETSEDRNMNSFVSGSYHRASLPGVEPRGLNPEKAYVDGAASFKVGSELPPRPPPRRSATAADRPSPSATNHSDVQHDGSIAGRKPLRLQG